MVLRNRLEEFYDKAKKPKFKSTRYEKPPIDDNAKFILDFLKKVSAINERFNFLESKVTEVIMVQSHILEFSQTDAGLYSLYDNIKDTIGDLVNTINGLEKTFDPKTYSGSEVELKIFNTQLMSLKKRIATLITRYYSIQEEYKSKCRARITRQAQIAGADITRINIEEALGYKTEVFMQTVFPDFDMTHHYLGEIKKRHEDIIKLEKTIAELHELFFDLALVIQVDFGLMDRIDKHSTYVDKLVALGLKDVKGYKGAVRTGKLRRYLIIGCIIFVFAIIGLAIHLLLKTVKS